LRAVGPMSLGDLSAQARKAQREQRPGAQPVEF
jgi:hypothetical protein